MYRWRRFTIRRALLYSHCDRTSRQIKIINLSSHIDTSSTTWPLSALTGNRHTDLLAIWLLHVKLQEVLMPTDNGALAGNADVGKLAAQSSRYRSADGMSSRVQMGFRSVQ